MEKGLSPVNHPRGSEGPVISVVVTSYNYGKFLNDALGSVKAQSFQAWECIIVDDGSDDDTPEIANAWTASDQRFKYVRQENAGLPAARNIGLSKARGRYIQILDADDTISPRKFHLQEKLLNDLPDDSLVYSSYERLDETGSNAAGRQVLPSLVPRGAILTSLIRDWERGFSIPPHCFLFRRSHLEAVGRFADDLETHEDLDLYIKLAAAGVAFVHHDDDLAVYRRHSANMTRDRARMARGYLLALGHASRRVASRRERLLVTYRYLIEFERCLTDWILQRHESAFVGSILANRYALLSALGLLAYPFLVCRRLVERSWRKYGDVLRRGGSPVGRRGLVGRQIESFRLPGNGSAATETDPPRRLC